VCIDLCVGELFVDMCLQPALPCHCGKWTVPLEPEDDMKSIQCWNAGI